MIFGLESLQITKSHTCLNRHYMAAILHSSGTLVYLGNWVPFLITFRTTSEYGANQHGDPSPPLWFFYLWCNLDPTSLRLDRLEKNK